MRFPRRTGTVVALAAVVSMTATACFGQVGGDDDGGGEVVFANTGGELAEVFQEHAYPVLEDEGVTVSEESPNNEAKLTAMVEGGNPTWDVFYSAPYIAMGKCGELFEEIDYERIDTEGLDESQRSDCGVPVMNSYFLLVYNKDTYEDNPPTSWADFYDPDEFPGTRGIMDHAKDAGMETALLGSGVDGDELYPLDYERAFETLDKIRSDLNFYDTGAQQTQALESGEVDMMLAWPGRAYDAVQNGADLGVAHNQPLKYYDALTIVKDAPNHDQAYDLINALIAEENQSAVGNAMPYEAANSEAGRTDDEDIRAFVADDEKANGTIVVRDDEWWSENLDEATQRWTSWVNR